MATTPGPELDPNVPLAPIAATPPADRMVNELGTLLGQLQEQDAGTRQPTTSESVALDNQLVQVRLGIASSLFVALQLKHAAIAGHALRVALTTSAWAVKLGLPPQERDHIEIAALLHDVGAIGIPDDVLNKPAPLDADEVTRMAGARRLGLEILRRSCAAEILVIVENIAAWFNDTSRESMLQGRNLPLGSRMIAIAEAFDAMITGHVYRSARSLESAMTELFECAGTQFDPALVRQFAEFHLEDHGDLHRHVAGRWLHALDPRLVNSYWHLNCVPSPGLPSNDTLFQAKLLDNMYDAVIFVDAAEQVAAWNHGAERLTGIPGNSIRQRRWNPDLLGLRDEKGNVVLEADCPIECALRSGAQSLRRMTVCGRSGRAVSVDTHAMPVVGESGAILGAILLLHDASSETSLEQRCQSLYEKATKDGLTQVANRAEFDRVHKMFIAAHEQQKAPCSMIICDIDHFKLVNDTYGHQAGDEAIQGLATLLKSACHPGDLVARYGGEEFVMLCADCDNATAARRAEQVRKTISQLAHAKLNGHAITVSFGVTEIQPGDTAETMLRRADRALLMAKSKGRNMVVQLGSGSDSPPETRTAARFWRRKPADPEMILEQDMVTPVPFKIALEKLRGFVADHQAKVVAIDSSSVRLQISDTLETRQRRRADRPVSFLLDLRLEEEQPQKENELPLREGITRTRIHVAIGPLKNRDRRRGDVASRAREMLVSLRSYMMASDAAGDASQGVLRRVQRILVPWLGK
jgi:diguanylate cyclase (GGDEF)-like protein